MSLKLVALIIILKLTQTLTIEPTVLLPNGVIKGKLDKTEAGRIYYSFQGIPYASPPTGELRFKAPQPAPHWKGTKVTQAYSNICYQIWLNTDQESEDCLYINVFTTKLPSDQTRVYLPVMVFIYGGGFVAGAADFYSPDLFINHDVVFVTFNYRVGVFGFISTQDEVIPGNNGLKDQQLALQWIHDHIPFFGGDPERITIFGQSAGSASCGYQLLNLKNEGLFRAAILQSGSFLSPWAFQRRAREIAFATAAVLDPTFESSNDSQALLDFLLTVEAKDLEAAAEKYHNEASRPDNIEISQGFYYAPVIEVKNPDAFLTKKMYRLLEAGNVVRVPIIIGITSEESLMFNPGWGKNVYFQQTKSNLAPDQFLATMTEYDKNLDWVVPNDMQISDKNSKVAMGKKIRELYIRGEPFAEHLGYAIRYFSDTSFTRSVIKHAELFSNFAKTYFYEFSYDGLMGQNDIYYNGSEAVSHAEDLLYLFCSGDSCNASSYPESDGITRQRLVELWINFAKYLNPTLQPLEILQNVTWPTVNTTTGDFYYLDIGENLEIKNHPKEVTYKGWTELYESLNFTDFDTY